MSISTYESPKWWKECAVYQVYPASFVDSNGDGWGDVKGAISKLDYLKDLGVEAIWLSPIFKSPQVDMGYDISNYQGIDPIYGSLEDVDHLIAELGARDMKLVMDLVVNHTSDEHAWFKESISSKTSPKRSWYIWKSPSGISDEGIPSPPNNWSSILGQLESGGSAWTYDPASKEYYLTLFTPNQPDLNWENPEVREAVYSVMRFWLDRGVKGFRMDVINCISKDQRYVDAEVVDPSSEFQPGFAHFVSGPRFHEFLQEMNREVMSKYDALTVGECDYAADTVEEAIRTIDPIRKELNMIFQFEYINLDHAGGVDNHFEGVSAWTAADLSRTTARLHDLMRDRNGWLTQVLENHDQCRSVGRFVPDSGPYVELGAKLLALMETTLAGTLYLYQGQELGMRNAPASWPVKEYRDIFSQNYWSKVQAQAEKLGPKEKKEKLEYGMHSLQRRARDHARLPMMWSNKANAGFCDEGVEPWMRVHDDYKFVNVDAQVNQENGLSVYQFWKRGLNNRKMHRGAFVYGGYRGWDMQNKKVFAYERWTTDSSGIEEGQDDEKSRWLIVCNFSNDEVQWTIPEQVEVKSWVAGNYSASKVDKETRGKFTLRPWEGLLGGCAY